MRKLILFLALFISINANAQLSRNYAYDSCDISFTNSPTEKAFLHFSGGELKFTMQHDNTYALRITNPYYRPCNMVIHLTNKDTTMEIGEVKGIMYEGTIYETNEPCIVSFVFKSKYFVMLMITTRMFFYDFYIKSEDVLNQQKSK